MNKEYIKRYLAEGKKNGKKLNHYKMLQDICNLVETDFCQDMELKLMPNSSEYTKKESQEMANLLARIYGIAHCITCKACQHKYATTNKRRNKRVSLSK